VSIFQVGIGFSAWSVFFQVGSVFIVGISKYRDVGSVFSVFQFSSKAPLADPKILLPRQTADFDRRSICPHVRRWQKLVHCSVFTHYLR